MFSADRRGGAFRPGLVCWKNDAKGETSMKKRFLAMFLALILALLLVPAGLASSVDTYDYQPSPDFGTYLGMREDGVFEFEITIPADEISYYFPFVIGHFYSVHESSDTSIVGFSAQYLHGHKPGTATVEYKVYSDYGQIPRLRAVAYVTVVPKAEFDPSVNVGFANVQPPEPVTVTPGPQPTPAPTPSLAPTPTPAPTPSPIPTPSPSPAPTAPGTTAPGGTPTGTVAGMDLQKIYQAMIALKEQYPEGTHWTNDNSYSWHGGIYSGGRGCAGFAFMLSDAAFGNLPARKLTNFSFSDVRVGDILRINNDTHSVIVLAVYDDHVVLAEGNYNNSVHWGRTLTAADVQSADYLLTRYPEEIPAASVFTDVPGWCSDAVDWAVYKEITNGATSTTFAPNAPCTNAMILTFLWRAADKPTADYRTFSGNEYYTEAINWAFTRAMISKNFDPYAPCTRADAVRYIWQAVSGGLYCDASGIAFTDLPAQEDLSEYAWAVANGITNGTSATTFGPNDTCTRGQIVTFLHRAYVPGARLTAS